MTSSSSSSSSSSDANRVSATIWREHKACLLELAAQPSDNARTTQEAQRVFQLFSGSSPQHEPRKLLLRLKTTIAHLFTAARSLNSRDTKGHAALSDPLHPQAIRWRTVLRGLDLFQMTLHHRCISPQPSLDPFILVLICLKIAQEAESGMGASSKLLISFDDIRQFVANDSSSHDQTSREPLSFELTDDTLRGAEWVIKTAFASTSMFPVTIVDVVCARFARVLRPNASGSFGSMSESESLVPFAKASSLLDWVDRFIGSSLQTDTDAGTEILTEYAARLRTLPVFGMKLHLLQTIRSRPTLRRYDAKGETKQADNSSVAMDTTPDRSDSKHETAKPTATQKLALVSVKLKRKQSQQKSPLFALARSTKEPGMERPKKRLCVALESVA